MDVETSDGHLSIVNYNFDDEEYILNIDGERYGIAKDFEKFVEAYDLAENMQSDVETFKEDLGEHGLSTKDLLKVEYKTICTICN